MHPANTHRSRCAAGGSDPAPSPVSPAPTAEPTATVTDEPFTAPTPEPTATVTDEPYTAPTPEPTASVTDEPYTAPTPEPSTEEETGEPEEFDSK